MKHKFKQWAWRTLLSILCLISTSSALAGFNIYVKPYDSNYYIHNWGGRIQKNDNTYVNDSWPGTKFNGNFNTQEIGGATWYVIPVADSSVSFLIHNNQGKQTEDVNNISSTMFVTWDGNAANVSDVTSTYSKYLDEYTVVGSSTELFGTTWDTGSTTNNMTTTDYVTWTWSRSKVELSAGNVEYKAVKNHDYENGRWPYDGNATLNIPRTGKYDVTITLNISTNEISASATYVPEVVYLFGSVGKSEAWYYSDTNPKLMPDANFEEYTGVWDVNEMPSYTERNGQYGLFLLTTGFGTNWETTVPYMIGTESTEANNHFWIDGGDSGNDYYGDPLAAIAGHTNGWTLPSGTYEFVYNRLNNTLKVTQYDGPVIYVYDYTRPYIYVKDGDGNEFNGAQPGAPILNLDETVGGHSGMSSDGDITKDGVGKLGWYKFAVPSNTYPITFDLKHNGDNQVSMSEFIMSEGDRKFYCYWTGSETTKFAQLTADDPNHLRRIVAHVRVQGTTVPTCDEVPMNGPSSFYGQMYYWMAVTTYNDSFKFIISDGEHSYTVDAKSDFYIELGENGEYVQINENDLKNRLANKTGRGTIIHLLKNNNTPVEKEGQLLGIDTQIHSGSYYNTTNQGATWWGKSLNGEESSKWKGTVSHIDNGLSNYNGSRFIYLSNGVDGDPDVYTITSEDGQEWYTWYSDRSTATIKFGYGNIQNDYPNYTQNNDVYKLFMKYESKSSLQTAGELWYVWTPDFTASLTNGQSQNNGELIDVTRTYESRAKQKAMCSTVHDGNFVYYTDIKGWDMIYCYVWNNQGEAITPWPGVKMTKVGYDDEGHPVYLADLSLYDVTNAGGILFNDGNTNSLATDKRQTGDLEWENGGCYDYLGLLYRIGGNADVIENEPNDNPASLTLTGVWYSRVKGTLFAKTDNDYNNKSVNGYGYTDYAKSTDLQTDPYDQSYWVEIMPAGNVTKEMLKDLVQAKFTLYGIKLSSVNPCFEAISVTRLEDVYEYTPNLFTPAHFMGMYQQCTNGINYFFVEPKPNEFVKIKRAIFVDRDNASQTTSDGYNRFIMSTVTGLQGSFNVDWGYHDKNNANGNIFDESTLVDGGVAPDLINLTGYENWLAIVKVNEATATNTTTTNNEVPRRPMTDAPFNPSVYDTSVTPSATYTVYPICINDYMTTSIKSVAAGKGEVKAVRYYNLMGVESATPFEGVNIVVKEFSDGTRETSKVVK